MTQDSQQHEIAVQAVRLNCSYAQNSEVGGAKRSIAQAPTGNPSPAPTLTPRTHDTTDQWRETIRQAGPVFNEKCSVVADASKRMCPI